MFDPMAHPQHVVIDGAKLPDGYPGLPGYETLGPVEAVLYGDAERFDPQAKGKVAVAVAGGNWTVLTPDELREAVVA